MGRFQTLIYPPDGHVTDSKSIFLLGSARSFCKFNGRKVRLEENGNFCKLIRLKLGKNELSLNIDGEIITRIIYGKEAEDQLNIAYARPYASFKNQGKTSSKNHLRSILIDDHTISIPLNPTPEYKLDRVNAYHYRLNLNKISYDLDWIHYTELDPLVRVEQILPNTSNTSFDIKFKKAVNKRVQISFKKNYLKISFKPLKKTVIICIDAGHGGSQLGAVSPKGVYEKDLNLSLAIKLSNELNKLGIKNILTRNTDKDLSLQERVSISQKNNCSLFISLHHNALPDGRNPNLESGFSCHYFHEHSFYLAKLLASELKASSKQNFAGIYKQNLHVLRENPDMLGILLELGYLIHPLESDLLCQKSFQTKISKILAKTIQRIVELG